MIIGNTVRRIVNVSSLECGKSCIEEKKCKSINYGSTGKICQLKDKELNECVPTAKNYPAYQSAFKTCDKGNN